MAAASPARRLPLGVLLTAAGLAWVVSVTRMRGMDAGPSASLGTFGWFAVTWILMMIAMMLPVIAPLIQTTYLGERGAWWPTRMLATATFVAGYLTVWLLAGAAVFGLLRAGSAVTGSTLGWHAGGRWLVAAMIALAAIYQLTAAKRHWLERCRAPLPWSARRPPGRAFAGAGAGLRAGLRCLACSWALMLVLFALGAMSLVWMVVVTLLITAERLLPSSQPARRVAAGALMVLALGVAAAPADVPGFTVPGAGSSMSAMSAMR